MQTTDFTAEKSRFSLDDPSVYILKGNFPNGFSAKAFLDSEEISAELTDTQTRDLWEGYRAKTMVGGRPVTLRIKLPENTASHDRLKVYAVKGSEKKLWFAEKVKEIVKVQGKPYYFVDFAYNDKEAGVAEVEGWVVFNEPVDIKAFDKAGNKLETTLQRLDRVDVAKQYDDYTGSPNVGFFLHVKYGKADSVRVVFDSGEASSCYDVQLGAIGAKLQKASALWNKGRDYLRRNGILNTGRKVIKKLTKSSDLKPVIYSSWIKKHLRTTEELDAQRKVKFEYEPKISIVVALYKTPEKYLRALVDSIKMQTYANWELCLSDGSGADSPMTGLLEKLQKEDKRIKVIAAGKQLQISDNTNAAISIATGDWIAFADHDDTLTPDALYENVKAINEHPDLGLIYSDEDKMSEDGCRYMDPNMKPQFNLDLLTSANYICHICLVKKALGEEVGFLRPEFDGAQDHDFVLRCIEKLSTDQIYRIPRVLYHWRTHENSTSENPESKMYAFEAGRKAVQQHFDRIGVPAKVEILKDYLGLYRTKYLWEEKPLVSILIPNKDHTDDLERCISSIETKSKYPNIEYIIVENNSEKTETFEYYRQLTEKNPRAHVVYWKDIFNYSAINNFGEKYAKGDYLLLLNNDTEIINEDCIEEMLGLCMRPDVGAVGARLYYDDETVQHAGVVVGFGGLAGHCFVQQPRGAAGYQRRIISTADYSAVTAACMMVRRSAFEEVEGFYEGLAVAFNDIDFCMKLRKAGYLIVYDPYAELYHYESKSRGLEDTPEKVARFNKEVDTFAERWPDIIRDGDPYYSPNLSLVTQDFQLKQI